MMADQNISDSNGGEGSYEKLHHLCDVCGKWIQRRSLKAHVRAHGKEDKPYQCRYCPKRFSASWYCNSHERFIHTGIKLRVTCRYCVETFNDKGARSAHETLAHGDEMKQLETLKMDVGTHSGKKIYQCRYCPKKTDNVLHHVIHGRRHTGEKPYPCPHCDKSFASIQFRRFHEKQVHSVGQYSCQYCEKKFVKLGLLHGHECAHRGVRPFPCQFCEKTFMSDASLENHVKIHSGEKPYHCRYCDEKFSEAESRNSHEKIHSTEKLYSCQVCAQTFPWLSQLAVHQIIHRVDEPFGCRFCSVKLRTTSACLQHENNFHPGGELFSCEICGLNFGNTKTLKIHQREICGKICRFCGKTFTRVCARVDHETVHTGKRPYSCQYCDKSYCRPSALKIHQAVHTGEKREKKSDKRYFCRLCDKNFVSSSYLRRHHVKTHTRAKPYCCQYCARTFAFLNHLSSHVKRSHMGDGTVELDQIDDNINHGPDSTTNGRESSGEEGDKPSSSPSKHNDTNVNSSSGTEKLPEEASGGVDANEHGRPNGGVGELIYEGDSPYPCRYCEKEFTEPGSRRIHERIHIGMVYSCQTCDRTFPTLLRLQRHEVTHTGEKPYPCRYCDKAYSLRKSRDEHQKTRHRWRYGRVRRMSRATSRKNQQNSDHAGVKTVKKKQCSNSNPYRTVKDIIHTGEKPHHGEYSGDYNRRTSRNNHEKKARGRVERGEERRRSKPNRHGTVQKKVSCTAGKPRFVGARAHPGKESSSSCGKTVPQTKRSVKNLEPLHETDGSSQQGVQTIPQGESEVHHSTVTNYGGGCSLDDGSVVPPSSQSKVADVAGASGTNSIKYTHEMSVKPSAEVEIGGSQYLSDFDESKHPSLSLSDGKSGKGTHFGDRLFSCGYCGMKFKDIQNSLFHLTMDTGPNSCLYNALNVSRGRTRSVKKKTDMGEKPQGPEKPRRRLVFKVTRASDSDSNHVSKIPVLHPDYDEHVHHSLSPTDAQYSEQRLSPVIINPEGFCDALDVKPETRLKTDPCSSIEGREVNDSCSVFASCGIKQEEISDSDYCSGIKQEEQEVVSDTSSHFSINLDHNYHEFSRDDQNIPPD